MTKPIVITDESVVNDQGFRVLTSGGDLSQYMKSPILLYDHVRRYGNNDKEIILPIGKMTNIQLQGSQYIATPDFDLEDEFAAEVARKYEKDILNMASIGFEAIEWSEDPAVMLPGQKYPTVTKWILREVSITDIGSNSMCSKVLHNGQLLTLSEKTRPEDLQNFFNSNKPVQPMKKVIAALNASKLLTLNEASAEELVASGVETLVVQLSAKDQVIASKDVEIKRLQDEAKDAATKGLKAKGTTLVEGALSAKKIVAAQKEKFINMASSSEEGYIMVKEMLDSMAGFTSVTQQLSHTEQTELPKSIDKQKELFDKHIKEGTMSTLSAESVKTLWKAKHDKEISELTLKSLMAQ